MNKQNTIQAILAVAVVGLGLFTFLVPTPTVNVDEIANRVQQRVGALVNPLIPSPYLEWGSVRTYQNRIEFATATRTPAVIQSPNATTTIMSAACSMRTATGTALNVYITRGKSSGATTTELARRAVGSGVRFDLVASSTAPQNAQNDNFILAPNTWVHCSPKGGRGFLDNASAPIEGYFSATFRQISY